MSHETRVERRLERQLAVILAGGTWLASALIALGVALCLLMRREPTRLLTLGTALIICLPILRLLMMQVAFTLAHDIPLAVVTSIVLVIIALGAFLGAV